MNNGSTISIGSTGPDVRRLQRIFVMTKVLAPANITGNFDSTSEQAVKNFQQGVGLTVDGIVGPMTWQALPADQNTPLLRRSDSGSVVTALQNGLKKYSTPATDPGSVAGDFGPKTEGAVKAYQQDRGVQTELSATRRGGLPLALRVLLSRRCRDLRRCDLKSVECVANHAMHGSPKVVDYDDESYSAVITRRATGWPMTSPSTIAGTSVTVTRP